MQNSRGLTMVLAGLALASATAWAGGWASSGGGTFQDFHNPWLLVKNVGEVKYCILHDAESFTASVDQSRAAIVTAFDYWKEQFAKVPTMGTGSFAVGLHTFREVDCAAGAPDIRFVLGYGKLTNEEVDFFKDEKDPDKSASNYIGVAVRTEYDTAQMRGKGFVYISSDKGPHAYKNGGNLITEAWSKPNLLQYALIHETGHVFGFPHTGSGIMSEVFLEQMLDEHLTTVFQKNPLQPFLYPKGDSCGLSAQDRAWWGVPPGMNCIRMDFSPFASEVPIEAYAQGSPSAGKIIGRLRAIALELADSRARPGVFLHLTPNQTVFSGEDAGFRSFMVGPGFLDLGGQANYLVDGVTGFKSVYFRVTSSSLTMIGEKNGKLGLVFSFTSPIDTLLFVPPVPSPVLKKGK